MLHVLFILMVMALFLHDASALGALREARPDPLVTVAFALGAPLLTALAAHLWIGRCARRLDRTGSGVYVASAEAALLLSRIGVVALHVMSVLLLGWLDLLRHRMHDAIVLPELAALVPPTLALCAGWYSYYPIEERLRAARMFGAIERGEVIYPERTRWVYVLDQFRHHALLVLTPLVMILAWSQSLALLAAKSGWTPTSAPSSLAYSAVQLSGVAVVFVLTPPIMRRIWSTRRLGPGELRDRLDAMCAAHHVRHRGLLVWRTHGTMINGAVLGFVPSMRYIMLTDALLDHLPQEQLEAVMAHEIGHVRRRHLPWLLAAMAAALGLGGALVWLAFLPLGLTARGPMGVFLSIGADVIALVGSLAFGLWAFGMVSRRFERQADAFAAQHFSGMTAARESTLGKVVTREAAHAMADALQSVATLNMIPRTRRFWRHGSIADRQRRVLNLIGAPLNRAPIDREVAYVKFATLLTLLALGVLFAWRLTNADM